jgi:hypothetical protein
LRFAPTILVVFSISGCIPIGQSPSPDQPVRGYLFARNVKDRMRFVLDADSVEPLLQTRPGESKFGFDQVNLRLIERLACPGEWYTVRAYTRRATETAEIVFYVGRVADAFKIDWKASFGYNPAPLAAMLSDATDGPQRFRVKARLANYYYHDFWATDPQFQCVDLTDEDSHTCIHGYVRRQSDHGRMLLQLIRDGAEHPVTLDLRRIGPRGDPITDPEADVVTISDFVSTSWLY